MIQARLSKAVPPAFRLEMEFSMERGVTALVGPAGCGKTLALELLAGFARPDSGRILLDDAILFDAATGVSIAPRLRGCGYVRQRDSLFPGMTLRRNMAFAARGSRRLERARRVAETMERFDVISAAGSRPGDLTPAQRLRGELARAVMASPKLLMLDERGIGEPLLRTLREVFTGPILLVTADLDLCCAAADDVILLEAGRIVQSGDARAVADRPASPEAAALLGIPNVFEGVIAALDPGRGTSRLELAGFALAGPYIPGHFRGDRVKVAVRAEKLRVHPAELDGVVNGVGAALVRVSKRARSVRLEFAGGIFADISHEEFERQKDNKGWQVEFPPEALRVCLS